MPLSQMIDGGTHGDQHIERLFHAPPFLSLFVFVGGVRPSNLFL